METLHDVAGTSADPRPNIAAKDATTRLWTLVGQLDENSREALSLYYGQQMNVAEIAELTGMRESAVKMRLKKARTILGGRAAELQGFWSVAPMPVFSADIMAAVKAVGPVKAGAAALSPVLGWFAFLAVPGWFLGKDAERWRGHAPAGMERQTKRNIVRSIVLCVAVFLAAPPLTRLLGHDPRIMVPYLVVALAFLAAIFWREIALVSPREKAKQFINAGCVILLFVVMAFNPPKYCVMACFGGFMAMQYFLVNKAGLAQGAVMPGCWVAPLLQRAGAAECLPAPLERARLRPWLTMLHELGLVAPPCKTEAGGIRVRLRLRSYIGEKMARGGNSSLHVDARGVATCSITPRDYVALAQHFGNDELPARRELGAKLGESFTRGLNAYAQGADKTAVAEALGLGDCPVNVTKTHIYLVNKYLFPLVGILIIAVSVALCFVR